MITLYEDRDHRITCQSHTDITWYHDKKIMDKKNMYRKKLELKNGALIFKAVKFYNAGIYTCRGRTLDGYMFFAESILQVMSK